MTNIQSWLDEHRVINASGTMTSLGASSVSPEVADAVRSSLSCFADMGALQAFAGGWIARATGSEAGCVTASAAAGLAVSVAACITGLRRELIESLPSVEGVSKNGVILQNGHAVDFGSSIRQMAALGGGRVVGIGSATSCEPGQLAAALTAETAAALYVVSHHTAQSGMISFPDFVAISHAAGVPVIVDAASEYDLRIFIEQGADLVLYSAHKFLGGPTAGIIAGRKDLVRACYVNQSIGIGRAMKVGKEGIIGVVAVLSRWISLDHRAVHAAEYRRLTTLRDAISALPGIQVSELADPTGNPITRLRVEFPSPALAARFAHALSQEKPPIIIRGHNIDNGFFEIDPCNLLTGDVQTIVARFGRIARESDIPAARRDPEQPGPRRSAYHPDGTPAVDRDQVPWQFAQSGGGDPLFGWPDIYANTEPTHE